MKIFIDFDDTIFNTRDFIRDFKKIFWKHGISQELFFKHYYDYPVVGKDESRILHKYDFEEHANKIERATGLKLKKLRQDVDKLLRNNGRYIFSDVKNFLDRFGKENIFLVSYARTSFQDKKIKESKILSYFKDFLLSDSMKGKSLKRLMRKHRISSTEKIFFIEDRVEQLESVKKELPNIFTIFLKRKEARYNDKKNTFCDFEVKSLWPAAIIIKRLTKQQKKV
jgi:FMN phosphatase YigB (HAD superfamily)